MTVAKAPLVERVLHELQGLARRSPHTEPAATVMSGRVPEDLKTEDCKWISLDADEAATVERLRVLLSDDLRFEYLKEGDAKNATWRFVCRATLQRGDLVPDFVTEHAREPMERTCFRPVELLTVEREIDLFGVRLLPPSAVTLPEPLIGHDPRGTMSSVIAVIACGTDYNRMAVCARAKAVRALRLLRATLRADHFITAGQLRFRLGESVWFDDGATGWAADPSTGSDLTLDDELLQQVTDQPIADLPEAGCTDVQRRADLAVQWFERGQLTTEPIVELLYLFFALEAILGDRAEGQKAATLAVRRATLGLLTSGHFRHPATTYLLYDEVRSTAVHGEQAPQVDRREIDAFAWDVRIAINELMAFAAQRGLVKRSRVRTALDSDERRQGVVDALIRDDPQLWGRQLGET